MAESTRVALVDDHPLLAQMLADRLRARGVDCVIVDVAVDETDLPAVVHGSAPDLVLLDAVLHDDPESGMRVLRTLTATGLRIAMLTGITDEIRHAEFLEAGAEAVITKSNTLSEVMTQLDRVIDGHDPHGVTRRAELADLLARHRRSQAVNDSRLVLLTESERATLQMLVDGLLVDEIARRRTVASSTIRSHVRAILRKLDANSQIKAVSIAVREGMLPSPIQNRP